VTILSGGVGGARAARGFAAILDPPDLTVIVNVGDDDRIHGVHVSADLDTVVYTLAGREGPHGWGLADDSFDVMQRLASLGVDTTFRIGDADLATCLARTAALDAGEPLSRITARIAASRASHRAAGTDDGQDRPTRSRWLAWGTVMRGQRDESLGPFEGAEEAAPSGCSRHLRRRPW
jgi:2-phospho-L-lactate transferase